jgi:galactonate dehydratase
VPVKRLRDRLGFDIEIAIEFHAQWNVPSAVRIAHALEPYRPMWLEDMLMPGNFGQYREVAASTSLPLIAGERMAGKMQLEELLRWRMRLSCRLLRTRLGVLCCSTLRLT